MMTGDKPCTSDELTHDDASGAFSSKRRRASPIHKHKQQQLLWYLGVRFMSAIFELPIESETLTPDEIVQITGCQRRTDQVEWLTCNGWAFHKNKIGDPIVGRFFARLKMAGIRLDSVTPSAGMPDFSKVR
jgi:hypothetical protein